MHPPGCMQISDVSEEYGMKENLDHKAAEIKGVLQDQVKTDLSRRTLLARLTILGVGCAAAMTLGVGEADATIETITEPLAEGKKPELVEGVDPQQFAQLLTPGERRRVRRRTRRLGRRVRRRTRRRMIY
jgi:hypothetical protein